MLLLKESILPKRAPITFELQNDQKRRALGELELADSSLPIHSLGTIYPGESPRANRVNSALAVNAVLSLEIDDQRARPRLVARQNLSKPMKFPRVLPPAITNGRHRWN